MILPLYLVLTLVSLLTIENTFTANRCMDLGKCTSLSWLYALKGSDSFAEKKSWFRCNTGQSSLVHCPSVQKNKGVNKNVTECWYPDKDCNYITM